jgi:DnaK suppressor protein
MPDRQETRAVLLAVLAQAEGRLAALDRDFRSSVEAAAAANADDEHDPEGATLAFERQHVAALIEQARAQVLDVTAALDRLDEGRYGQCVRCGEPIAPERLVARPAAALCIGCASRAARGAR